MPDDQNQTPDDQTPSAPPPAPAGAPAAPATTYVGVIDRLAQGRLSGWAVTIDGEPCDVLIRVNDAPVATLLSDVPRPDLHAKQQSRGLGGWGIGIGAQLRDGQNRIEALFPDGTHLRGSPMEHDSDAGQGTVAPAAAGGPKTYVGAIDTPDRPVISGWAVGSDFTAAAVVVQVNDATPITVPANGHRADLIAQHLTQSGGGWSIDVTDLLGPAANRIAITFPDGVHLPGSPIERPQPGATAATARPAPATFGASPFGKAVKKPTAQALSDIAEVRAPASPPPAPAARPAPAPAPAQSNVTPFPGRAGKGGMPSLPELDELSLDDLSHAIAAGIIDVAAPTPPEPVPDPVPAETAAAPARAPRSERGGFLSRLFGRG